MRWLSQKEIKSFAARKFNINSKGFFERCWNEGAEVYQKRLKAISFENYTHVLDAGCGLGQWTACLAGLNKKVTAIDIDESHIKITSEIMKTLELENVLAKKEDVTALSFPNESFDAIFCYSVCYLTDYLKTFNEFYRVLKKDGKFYLKTNDLGRYLYMFMEEPNKSDKYEPRQVAIDAISHSFEYFSGMGYRPGKQVVMPINKTIADLQNIGFAILNHGPEGKINLSKEKSIKSFYPENYYGIPGVYEILATKK